MTKPIPIRVYHRLMRRKWARQQAEQAVRNGYFDHGYACGLAAARRAVAAVSREIRPQEEGR